MVSILAVGLSVRLLCPDFFDPSSLAERTSDNQRLGTSNDNQLWITLVRNDLPQFAIYQIVAFFMDNKNAIKD